MQPERRDRVQEHRRSSWVGDDNSAKPNQRPIGNALTFPRYPSNVYYNVASRADQLDEYN